MRIEKNCKIIDFTFTTQKNEPILLSNVYSNHKHTLILFLRYYGCTVCQLDLMAYKEKYHQ